MSLKILLILIFALCVLPLPAKEKDATAYGAGLIVNVPFPESEVAQAVQEVIDNGMIRGTKEYNKDEYIAGATAATSTRVFPQWTEGGKVFYKVRLKALDPRGFKDSSDVGTLAVRYVVQAQGDKNTVVRIDARFVEDFRHVGHPSDGSVESAEYKAIHDHLESAESIKAQTAEAESEKQQHFAKAQTAALLDATPTTIPEPVPTTNVDPNPKPPEGTASAPQSLEQHIQDLKHQVQRTVKAPGAPLQSAPFHGATTLQSLPAGTEVLIVVSTPYWYGVETHQGQHGWILRDELEQVP
jgi:hypothetical protein